MLPNASGRALCFSSLHHNPISDTPLSSLSFSVSHNLSSILNKVLNAPNSSVAKGNTCCAQVRVQHVPASWPNDMWWWWGWPAKEENCWGSLALPPAVGSTQNATSALLQIPARYAAKENHDNSQPGQIAVAFSFISSPLVMNLEVDSSLNSLEWECDKMTCAGTVDYPEVKMSTISFQGC